MKQVTIEVTDEEYSMLETKFKEHNDRQEAIDGKDVLTDPFELLRRFVKDRIGDDINQFKQKVIQELMADPKRAAELMAEHSKRE